MDKLKAIGSVGSLDSVFDEDINVQNNPSTKPVLLDDTSSLKRTMSQRRRSSIFETAPREKPSGSITMTALNPIKSSEEMNTVTSQVQYENSYILEPTSKLQPDIAREVIYDILKSNLEGMIYDPIMHSTTCKWLAQEIKDRLASPALVRYKLVVFVAVGQKRDQDVRLASRCLWDTEKDGSASAHYENSSLYASATVFALYYE